MGKNKKQTYDLEERLLEYTEIAVECLDIRFSFDVGRSMFDVRCSSFKTISYGINITPVNPKKKSAEFFLLD
jgi:hypothetical protein